jgi:hypothetical protein
MQTAWPPQTGQKLREDQAIAKAVAIGKMRILVGLLAGMGQMAKAFVCWRPRKFVGVPLPKPRHERKIRVDPPHKPEHLVAVTAQRAARRRKRIIKAEHLLTEKRRRQHAQWLRHENRLARLSRPLAIRRAAASIRFWL